MRIGFTACKIGLAAFIVPFMFAYEPTLIAEGDFWHIAWAVLTAVIGVMALAGSTIGFVVRTASVPERAMLLAGSLMTLHPGIYTDIIGLILIALALGANIIKGKKLVGKVSARSFIP
jgi:TRAP-type uncharacterized transport system fused permease subunit